jgi:hypothetical protein
MNQQSILGGPITPFYPFPFLSHKPFDICLRVQHSQKQSALLLANNDPSAQQKSWFGREVQKNIVAKLIHNIHLLQSIITGNRKFRQAIRQENSTVISLLHTLDHNIHSLDESQDIIITRLDTLAAQNATIMSHLSITLDHTLFPPTPSTPPQYQMKLQVPPFLVSPSPSSESSEPYV